MTAGLCNVISRRPAFSCTMLYALCAAAIILPEIAEASEPCDHNIPPVPAIRPLGRLVAGVPITFDGLNSRDPDGTIVEYFWGMRALFDPDRPPDVSGDPQWYYRTFDPGDYQLLLFVCDSCNNWTMDVEYVTVQPDRRPVAQLSTPTTANVGQSVHFNAAFSDDPDLADGDILYFDWAVDGEEVDDHGAILTWSFSEPGSHQVAVAVTDLFGLASFITKEVSVVRDPCQNNLPPVAVFTMSEGIRVNQPAMFDAHASNDPDGSVLHYSWKVDGINIPGDMQQMFYTFDTAGPHEVRLYITDACGAQANATRPVTVQPDDPCGDNSDPQAAMDGPSSASRGSPVSFSSASHDPDGDSTIASYEWRVDNLVAGSSAALTWTFPSSGAHDVRLTVTDTCGASDTAALQVSVMGACDANVPPVANLLCASTGHTGQPMAFDGSTSVDSDGSISAYEWRVDGAVVGGSVAVLSYTFTTIGLHEVRLTVTDNCGAQSPVASRMVTLSLADPCEGNLPPVPVITGPTVAQVNHAVQFSSANSSDPDGSGDIVSREWRIVSPGGSPNGSYAGGGVTLTRTFTSAGTYTVRLIVYDNCQHAPVATQQVVVSGSDPCQNNHPPVANISGPTACYTNQAVSFSGAGSSDPDGAGQITSYQWRVNNVVVGSSQTLSYTFTSAGTYTVQLTVTDSCAATGQAQQSVSVTAAPPPEDLTAEFDMSSDVGQIGDAFRLTAHASESVVAAYMWAFSDGGAAGGRVVEKWFRTAGQFTITLTVLGFDGTMLSTHQSVTVNPGLQLLAKVPTLQPPSVWDVVLHPTENIAYVSNANHGVASIDISAPSHPATVHVNDDAPWSAEALALSGNVLFAAADEGVTAYQIGSDHYTLTFAGSVDIPNIARAVDIAVSGNYAYTANTDGNGSLSVVNVSNPNSPSFVRTVNLTSPAHGVAVSGSTLFVGTDAGVTAMSLSSPSNPTVLSTFATSMPVQKLAVRGNYAYLPATVGYTGALDILNVSNPSAISRARTVNYPGDHRDVAIWTTNDGLHTYAYVSGASSGVSVVDVSDPPSATTLGFVGSFGAPYGVAARNGNVYIGSSQGLIAISASTPSNPTVAGGARSATFVSFSTVSNNTLWICGAPSVLATINVATPNDPRLTSTHDYGVANDLVSTSAIVAFGGYNRIDFYDAMRPAEQVLLGSYSTYGSDGYTISALAFANGYLFVGGNLGVRVLDVSNPAVPSAVASIPSIGSIASLRSSGNAVYAAKTTGGMQVIDASNPRSPVLSGGVLATRATATRMTISGNLLGLVEGSSGIELFDIASQLAPQNMGRYALPAGYSAMDGALSGNRLFVTAGSWLFKVDVSNPASPRECERRSFSYDARSLTMSGGRVYVGVNQEILSVIAP